MLLVSRATCQVLAVTHSHLTANTVVTAVNKRAEQLVGVHLADGAGTGRRARQAVSCPLLFAAFGRLAIPNRTGTTTAAITASSEINAALALFETTLTALVWHSLLLGRLFAHFFGRVLGGLLVFDYL